MLAFAPRAIGTALPDRASLFGPGLHILRIVEVFVAHATIHHDSPIGAGANAVAPTIYAIARAVRD